MSAPGNPSMLVPLAAARGDVRPRLASLFGADFSALSITPSRADRAPLVVRAALDRLAPWDAEAGVDLSGWHVADLDDVGARRMPWAEARAAIMRRTEEALEEAPFVVALGGDHSVTWPLVAAASRRFERLGIIQLDVHHDVRPLDDGPSNGTPIRGIVEDGLVQPGDIVQVGIHPFGNRRSLTEYCDSTGIRRTSLARLEQVGADAVADEALELLAGCDGIWLTVDIDVLDRAFAPGTVAALPGGITPPVLGRLVRRICSDPRVRAVDVVEFDPERDVSSITAWNVGLVVLHALSAVAQRRKAR